MPITLTYPEGGALVAGGTGSIGQGVVEGFCRAGVPVLFTYLGGPGRDSASKAAEMVSSLGAKGYSIRARQVDLRDPAQIEAALDEVEEWVGRVHSVATASGGRVPFAKTADYDLNVLQDFLDNDALAYFRLFSVAVQRMRKTGGGSITCTSTIDVGKLALYNGASGMSKGAVESAVRHIAVEEAPNSIRANYVRIGWVGPTVFSDHPEWAPPADPHREPTTQDEMLAVIGHSHIAGIPMRRPGTLREAGDVFAFLASDQASYLTGQCIQMDGGEDR